MSHKSAKKIRQKLRDVQRESAPVSVEKSVLPLPPRLLMRRKDPVSLEKSEKLNTLPGQRMYQGGAILHPLSDRGMYQSLKKRGLEG